MRRRQIFAARSAGIQVETRLVSVEEKNPLLCECGYEAKTTTGLAAHKANSKIHKDGK